MKSKITHTSYIINFLDIDFNSDELSNILESETDEILNKINNPNLKDWELIFNALYTNKDSIFVYKSTRSYINEKYKEIVVHIPIPTNEMANWGVNKEQYIKTGSSQVSNKYADVIEINEFSQFNSRKEYILYCMRQAIRLSFEKGFIINKIKIKI